MPLFFSYFIRKFVCKRKNKVIVTCLSIFLEECALFFIFTYLSPIISVSATL
jgi:hypothetical protein